MNTRGLVILQLAFVLLVFGCGKQPERANRQTETSEPVRVAYLPIIPDLPLFVAQEQGLFQKHGLSPTLSKIAGSGNQVVETLSRGDADFGYLAYSTVLEAEQQALGTFVVLQHNVDAKEYPSLYALVAAPNSGIRSVSDLKGKTIGTFPGAAMLILTKLMLAADGLDPGKDVRIIQLAPPAQVAALKTGQVAALLALEPIGALAVNAGAGEYVDRWPLTPRVAKTIPTGGSVVMKKTLESRQEYVKKITAAIDEAIDYIRAHPDTATVCYVKYCDVPEAVAKDLPILHYWKSNEAELKVCQDFADLLHREGDLQAPLNVRSLMPAAK